MENLSMRDAFFDRIYEIARLDRNVTIVSADMGAPSLDKFRRDLPSQFVNVGIAEHNMVTVATGLALSGKKVLLYAIMPFATSRCFEMIKVDLSLMNLPVTVVGVGSGFSYDDSGPTHHSTEDITIMRALPNMTILNASDSIMAAELAESVCRLAGPSYVRLDRGMFPPIYRPGHDFSRGFALLREGRELCILGTGNMVHRALEVSDELARVSMGARVVDLYRLKPIDSVALLETIGESRGLVTLEEHLLAGGVGSAVMEILADVGKWIPVKRMGIQDQYYYAYGGRNNIQRLCGLDRESVTRTIMDWARPRAFKPTHVRAAAVL